MSGSYGLNDTACCTCTRTACATHLAGPEDALHDHFLGRLVERRVRAREDLEPGRFGMARRVDDELRHHATAHAGPLEHRRVAPGTRGDQLRRVVHLRLEEGLAGDGARAADHADRHAALHAGAGEVLRVEPLVQVDRRDFGGDVLHRHHRLEALRRRIGADDGVGRRRLGRRRGLRGLQEHQRGVLQALLDHLRGTLGRHHGAGDEQPVQNERHDELSGRALLLGLGFDQNLEHGATSVVSQVRDARYASRLAPV